MTVETHPIIDLDKILAPPPPPPAEQPAVNPQPVVPASAAPTTPETPATPGDAATATTSDAPASAPKRVGRPLGSKNKKPSVKKTKTAQKPSKKAAPKASKPSKKVGKKAAPKASKPSKTASKPSKKASKRVAGVKAQPQIDKADAKGCAAEARKTGIPLARVYRKYIDIGFAKAAPWRK